MFVPPARSPREAAYTRPHGEDGPARSACGGAVIDHPEISLVVSTVGRPVELGRLIESIQREAVGGPTIELVVVDQSPESLCRSVLDPAESAFAWVYARSDIGVSKGRNLGLSLARGEFVMFPDDDAWFPGETLARSVAHLKAHPEHSGLCSQLRDGAGRLSMLRWAPTARMVTKTNHHRTSIGSTMLFRTAAARTVGGFDEAMGPGAGTVYGSCEDADFLLRVVGNGGLVWYDPTVVMHHRDGRRDGGPDADQKYLGYGIGQGHMWVTHRFPKFLVASLLLRRLLGSVLWSLQGRGDIGRAHRSWVRGAINGLADSAPLDLGGQSDAPPPTTTPARANAPSGSEFGRSFSWRIAISPVGTISTFALTAIAARTLDPGELALFYSMLAALMIGPIVSRFGLGQRAIRELGAARTEHDDAVAVGLARRHVISALGPPLVAGPAIAALLFAFVAPDGFDVTLVLLVASILTIETWRLTISDVLTGLGRTGWAAALAHQMRATAVTIVVLLYLVLFPGQLDLTRLLALLLAVVVVLAIVGFNRLWSLPQSSAPADAKPLRTLLALGLPFLLVDLVIVVIARADVWLATAALPQATAALYSTASVLAVQIGVPIGLANVALAPLVAGYVAQNRLAELEVMVRLLSTIIGWIVLPVVIGLALFGDTVLTLAYGSDFGEAHRYLSILMIGNMALATLGASTVILLMANRQRLAMRLAIGWLAMTGPVATIAAFSGGPLSLAVASSTTTLGFYVLLSATVWVTTGIRLVPFLDPRRLTLIADLIDLRYRTLRPRVTIEAGVGER